MADINRFSEQVIDLAERMANVADAAKGKNTGGGMPGARWLVLPAAGAGLYALATSGAFTRQAKEVVSDAKARASELPEELLSRVHQATGSASNGRKTATGSGGKSATKRSGTRRKTASAR